MRTTPRNSAALFLVLSLVAGLGAFYLAFQIGTPRFDFFLAELVDAGVELHAVLAAHVVAVAIYCYLGTRSIARRGQGGLSLVAPALLPLFVAALGSHLAVGAVTAAIDLVPAFMVTTVRFTALMDALKTLLVGLAATAALAGIATVLGAARSLARPGGGGRSPLYALSIVASLLAGGAVLWVGFWAYPDAWGPAMFAAVATCVGCTCVGIAALAAPADTTRAPDLLLVMGAALVMVLALWLGQRLAGFFDYLEVLCCSAPPFRHDVFMAHAVTRTMQADWLGWTSFGCLAAVSLPVLLRRGGPIRRAATLSRLEARLPPVALLLALGALWMAMSTHRDLSLDALDGSIHPVARLEGFEPARSRSKGWPPVSPATVVIRADEVHLLAGPRLAGTDGLEGGGPGAKALSKILTGIFESRRRRRLSPRGEEPIVVARVEIPREEDIANAAVSLAAEGDVSFERVMHVVDVVRGARQHEVGLLVASKGSPPTSEATRAEIDHGVFPLGGPHGGWVRAHVARIRPAVTLAGPRAQTGLGLVVVVSERGFHIDAWGGTLPEGCGPAGDPSTPTIELLGETDDCTIPDRAPPPECAYDFAGLRRCLTPISEEYPEGREVQVGAEPSVSYQVVVRVLDECATSATAQPFSWQDRLFDRIVLPDSAARCGLALLPETVRESSPAPGGPL